MRLTSAAGSEIILEHVSMVFILVCQFKASLLPYVNQLSTGTLVLNAFGFRTILHDFVTWIIGFALVIYLRNNNPVKLAVRSRWLAAFNYLCPRLKRRFIGKAL